MRAYIPGLALCAAITAPSWFLGRLLPAAGAPVIALMAAMLMTAFFPGYVKKDTFRAGVKWAAKKILPCAVAFLGFGMNLRAVAVVSGRSLAVIVMVLAAVLAAAFLLGKRMKVSGNLTTLIGVGTAICGGSAIAAAAPVIGAEEQDVARAVSTIFLFNVAAVFLFPVIGRLLGLPDAAFGIWAGTSVNDTSSALAAGASWSAAAGNNAALEMAAITKLTRTLFILPVTLCLAVLTANKQRRGAVRLSRIFPWFVVVFAAAAMLGTYAEIPARAVLALSETGKGLIVLAMAGIGLNTDARSMVTGGAKPALLGFCCWAAASAASLAGIAYLLYEVT